MDLNDLRYFALIVEHGGFSAAERHAHITKSKLSRRVALLEDRLGVRLLQRSTRKLALTEAGRAFYEHCAAMVVEADAARQAVEQLRSEPAGTVRLTCPSVMAQLYVTRLVADFMRLHPKVRVELDSSDRIASLLEEGIDIALRPLDLGLSEPGLVARRVTSGRLVLTASPGYAASRPSLEEPAQLAQHDTIGALRDGPEQSWTLTAGDGRTARVPLRPRFLGTDFIVQYEAARGGVGVALLPLRQVWRGLKDGSLVHVAKDWGTPEQGIHVVFPSRRGMLPSVRALIDYLAERMPTAMAD
ncbi:MAG: LysR substrate-binding domain-containing protein [Nevskia sp.]|nr:LysR substrate-binding domain-containing protein [Nevskia sp.]